jgi:hypothetical protein
MKSHSIHKVFRPSAKTGASLRIYALACDAERAAS